MTEPLPSQSQISRNNIRPVPQIIFPASFKRSCSFVTVDVGSSSDLTTHYVNRLPLIKTGILSLISIQEYFHLHISVHCCFCRILSNLGTFRIRFKMSQSLTASSFFHVFATFKKKLFGWYNRDYSFVNYNFVSASPTCSTFLPINLLGTESTATVLVIIISGSNHSLCSKFIGYLDFWSYEEGSFLLQSFCVYFIINYFQSRHS